MESSYTTSSSISKTSSKKFDDPIDYIKNVYQETSESDTKKFQKYRKEWDLTKTFEFEPTFPLYILTEMTFSCNYRCPQCVLGDNAIQKELLPKNSTMSFELFKKIIDEGEKHQCRSLCVNNTNEPLLLNDLPERIVYARKHGFLDILMNTNGELFTEENSTKILKSGLTRLMISIDAHSKDTFSKIRVGGNYEKVKKNTLRLIELREKMGLKLPLIRTSFVRQRDNLHEMEDFKEFWQDKVDYIHIQEFVKPYDTAEDSRMENKKPDIVKNFRCDQPWNRVMIRADGSIHPCCSFYTYELHMGNVNESSIHTIWNSNKFNELRKLHFEGRYNDNPACKKCINSF